MINPFKRPGRGLMQFFYSGAYFCAMVLFSQGVSFADPPEDHEHHYYLSQHATLLVWAGVGIGLLAFLCAGLIARVSELEARLESAVRAMESTLGQSRQSDGPSAHR